MSMKWQFPKFDHRWRAMCSKEPQTNNNNLNLGINTHNIHTRADLKQSQPGQQTSKKMGQSFPINQHSQKPPHLEPMSSQSEVVCSKVTQSFIKPIKLLQRIKIIHDPTPHSLRYREGTPGIASHSNPRCLRSQHIDGVETAQQHSTSPLNHK